MKQEFELLIYTCLDFLDLFKCGFFILFLFDGILLMYKVKFMVSCVKGILNGNFRLYDYLMFYSELFNFYYSLVISQKLFFRRKSICIRRNRFVLKFQRFLLWFFFGGLFEILYSIFVCYEIFENYWVYWVIRIEWQKDLY